MQKIKIAFSVSPTSTWKCMSLENWLLTLLSIWWGSQQGGSDKGEPLRNKIEFLASFPTDFPIEPFCVKMEENPKMEENQPRKEVLQAFAQHRVEAILEIVSSSNSLWASTRYRDWMSGAKKDSTVYDSHQLAASQKSGQGGASWFFIILGSYTHIFRLLWTTSNE